MARFLRVIVPLVAVAVCLGGAEWVARRLGFGQPPIARRDAAIGYFLEPSRTYRRFDNLISVNRYGFRSVDFDAASVPADQHVLLIGDSVIYGNHHLDQAETVAARLQSTLRQEGEVGTIVSSMAVSSWSPVNQLAFYRRFGPFPSRQVWVVLSSHDLSDPIDRSYDRLPYRSAVPVVALQDVGLALAERARALIAPTADAAGSGEYRSTEPTVRELVALLKTHHAQVGLCFHVTARERDLGTVPEAQVIVEGIARDLDVAMLVTTDAYRTAERPDRAVFYDDIHLTAYGAETLAGLLRRHDSKLAGYGAPPNGSR